MKQLPSIFNDVIGPVMRGPSSSHTAASWRIARTALDILNEGLRKACIEFAEDGAWAPNYREQGTCMGINGGLLGLEITDPAMKDTDNLAIEKEIEISYRVSSFETSHANTVRLTLWGTSNKKVQIVAISKGGGTFQIQSVNGYNVQINGDLYEILFFTNMKDDLESMLPKGIDLQVCEKENSYLFKLKSSLPFSSDFILQLQKKSGVEDISIVNPILPVVSGRQTPMPFGSIESLLSYADEIQMDLGDLGLLYEKHLSGLTESELNEKMARLVQVVHNSIDIGLAGTKYEDRILHQQSHLISKAEGEGKLTGSVMNNIIANVSALMESKSAMEVIVAVPTAGSCGTVGGSLRAIAEDIQVDTKKVVKAYFAAGIVGAYFAMGPGFSAEEHGCQVECGAASGMAAAAITQLIGGTAKQAVGAASMAIQNMIGLVCDPIADRVEAPCLGKNISAAVNAYSSAIMAVSGFDAVIPLDQVINTVARVSKTMPSCVKCTGKGGLAITKEAIRIKNKLNRS
ncbi:L-serine ammonia-lyase, iron-sulfur-dependent, subunit alpha [Saccharicrinis sp. GN24d3]|uniref:L-serine ammonia-lyase, iron-sulfur-dependent, subunit alpha n=1 Tax=Saccharicrinis sp. GN24d3 TaxID=3458416 RepID=UPI0040369CF0